jgi:phosphate transport system substrate-binding protein
MKLGCVITCVVSALAALCGGYSHAQDQANKPLIVKASVSGASLLEEWGKSFSESPGSFRVVVYGASGDKAIGELIEGKTPLILTVGKVSRKQAELAREKGFDLVGQPIGHEGPAIITGLKNPVSQLTMEQLRRIFRGQVTNWKEVGGPNESIMVVVKPARRSDFSRMFVQFALEMMPFSKEAKLVPSFLTTTKVCSESKGLSIGLVPFSQLEHTDFKKGVKILALKRCDSCPAVMPSQAGFKDLSYPVGFPLYLYWNRKSQDNRIKRFVDYCVSRSGLIAAASK